MPDPEDNSFDPGHATPPIEPGQEAFQAGNPSDGEQVTPQPTLAGDTAPSEYAVEGGDVARPDQSSDESKDTEPTNWHPITDPIKAATLAKTMEESRDRIAAGPREGQTEKDYMDLKMSNAAETEDNNYEAEALARELNMTAEELRGAMSKSRAALIDYGRMLIERQRNRGEPLTLNQEVFMKIIDLVDSRRSYFDFKNKLVYTLLPEDETRGRLVIIFRDAEESVTVHKSEGWNVDPWKRDAQGSDVFGERGRYFIREKSESQDFDQVDVTKSRELRPEDVERLDQHIARFNSEEAAA